MRPLERPRAEAVIYTFMRAKTSLQLADIYNQHRTLQIFFCSTASPPMNSSSAIFQKLPKELQKASPLEIMDKALEKFGIYIAITFSREAIQSRIDEFTNRMSDMLHIERDAELLFAKTTTTTNPVYSHKMGSGEGKMYAVHTAISEKAERLFPIDPRQLEFTEELNFVPAPDVNSEGQKPFEFLVSHVQPDQELGDTIYNLTAVSTSIENFSYLQKKGRLSPSKVLGFALDIASMNHLHECKPDPIIHCLLMPNFGKILAAYFLSKTLVCCSGVDCDPSKLPNDSGTQPCQFQTVIAEFTVNGTSQPLEAKTASPKEVRRIFTMGLPFTGHYGGQILFGPSDGYLYFMRGDGGGSGDLYNFFKNKKSLLEKIMRLDVDSTPSAAEITKLGLWGDYTIPKDNPYIEDKELQLEIRALGMRNPWR
ncbi:HIPL1 protein [Capsicum galapagoense]